MDLLAQGLTGEDVAERLVLSSETVKTHIRNAMSKLEAHTRVHAVAIALREGFISGAGLVTDDERAPPPARPAHAADDRLRLRRGARRRPADLRRVPARLRRPHPRAPPRSCARCSTRCSTSRRLGLPTDDQQVLDREPRRVAGRPCPSAGRSPERSRSSSARPVLVEARVGRDHRSEGRLVVVDEALRAHRRARRTSRAEPEREHVAEQVTDVLFDAPQGRRLRAEGIGRTARRTRRPCPRA